jgi:hypothetical protein
VLSDLFPSHGRFEIPLEVTQGRGEARGVGEGATLGLRDTFRFRVRGEDETPADME